MKDESRKGDRYGMHGLISLRRAASGAHRISRVLQTFLLLPFILLSACQDNPSSDQLEFNTPGGLTLTRPDFLLGRAIDETAVQARVSVDIDSVNYPAQQIASSQDDVNWQGEVYVPEGSDVTLNVDWVETSVAGLPAELQGELLLATYSVLIPAVAENRAVEVRLADYLTESTQNDPHPELDLDGDGFGNLQERLADANPNDAIDRPADVLILFNPNAPVIDGRYDSLWNTAQFRDTERENLLIDKVLVDEGVVQPGEDRRYRWAGMHDGQFLYLLVFAEVSGNQTPFGDSALIYNDDAVDIFWDGNNSKGTTYDGIDDFHAIIALLSSQGGGSPNRTGTSFTRFEQGDRSAPITVDAFEFATCLCSSTGEQQLYEIKLDLATARIPVDKRFGLDIQLNNDVDGGARDAKWAWYNATGQDDTWRFPLRMGTARLEPDPRSTPQPAAESAR